MRHEYAEDLVETFRELLLLAADPRQRRTGQQRDDWNFAWDRTSNELTNLLLDAFPAE